MMLNIAIAKKSTAELLVTVFLYTIKLMLIYKKIEQLHKNYNLIFVPRTLGTFRWNPFHFILNVFKDMVCWKMYNFFDKDGGLQNTKPSY